MKPKINYLLSISYDGNYFHGWAKQPNLVTVQGELEKHLSTLFKEPILVIGSGRTDRYVHANAQTVSFQASLDIPIEAIKNFLNKERLHYQVNEVEIVSEDFHARFSSKEKTYRYKIKTQWSKEEELYLKNYYLLYEKPLDLELIIKASKILMGEHDFASFSAKENYETTIRTINQINFIQEENTLIIEFKGPGFLRYMIRNIVGSLLALNEDKITYEIFLDYLNNPLKGKSHYKAKGNALYLYKVDYFIN